MNDVDMVHNVTALEQIIHYRITISSYIFINKRSHAYHSGDKFYLWKSFQLKMELILYVRGLNGFGFHLQYLRCHNTIKSTLLDSMEHAEEERSIRL